LHDVALDGASRAAATHLWGCGVRRRCCSNASHLVRAPLAQHVWCNFTAFEGRRPGQTDRMTNMPDLHPQRKHVILFELEIEGWRRSRRACRPGDASAGGAHTAPAAVTVSHRSRSAATDLGAPSADYDQLDRTIGSGLLTRRSSILCVGSAARPLTCGGTTSPPHLGAYWAQKPPARS
jgi:hypothetical protein